MPNVEAIEESRASPRFLPSSNSAVEYSVNLNTYKIQIFQSKVFRLQYKNPEDVDNISTLTNPPYLFGTSMICHFCSFSTEV